MSSGGKLWSQHVSNVTDMNSIFIQYKSIKIVSSSIFLVCLRPVKSGHCGCHLSANCATMSLPGLDSGAVLVDHAWEAAAPWQVSCEEGEMVYRVGDESEDGWVEVQRARDGTRGSVPASYLGREVVPEAAVVVPRSPLPVAPDGWLVHSTDQGVLYYQNLVDGHVQWERPTRVASDLPPGAADAAPAPVTPTKAVVASWPASPPSHSPTSPSRPVPPLPPRCSTAAMPPPPPPRPEAVTPPPQQEGGRIASAREGASSALASASSGARGAKTVVAGHLNPTKEQKKGSAGVAFLRQKDLSKPTLMVPSKQYRVQLKDGTLYVLKTESNAAKSTIPCRDIATVALVTQAEAGGRRHCVKLLLRSVPGSHEEASRIKPGAGGSLFGAGGPPVGLLLEFSSKDEQKAWHTVLGRVSTAQKNWRSVQSAVGTGAKGLATGAKSLGAAAAAWGGMVAYHAAAPMGQVGGGVFGGFVGASAGAKVGEKIRKL